MKCKYCGSRKIVRTSYHYTRNEILPRYRCQQCLRSMSFSKVRFRYHHNAPAKVVLYAILRYFTHPTLAEIQKEVKEKFQVNICLSQLSYWIRQERKFRQDIHNRSFIAPQSLKLLLRLKREIAVRD